VNDSSCAPAHNIPVPLERSAPASFKRLLGCRRTVDTTSPRQQPLEGEDDEANERTVKPRQADALDDVDKMRSCAALPDEVTAVAKNAVHEAQDGADCSAEHARVNALEPPATSEHDERRTKELQGGQNEEESDRGSELIEGVLHSPGSPLQPNGSRLSCGRLARRRNWQWTKSRARQGTTQWLPLERSRPAASSAC